MRALQTRRQAEVAQARLWLVLSDLSTGSTYRNASNTKSFPPVFFALPVRSHHSAAFLDPLDSLQLSPVSRSQTAVFFGMLHLTCGTSLLLTLRDPCQFGVSSSHNYFPSSCSAPGSIVDFSRASFQSRIKTFLFSKSFPQ